MVVIVVAIQIPGILHKKDAQAAAADTSDNAKKLELVPGELPTVKMPADMVQRLGVKTAEVEPYSAPRVLKLDGTLLIDPSSMARVHSRFPGEIVEIGPSEPGNPKSRPIRFGDRVEKGQLVAAFGARIWAKKRASSSTPSCICGSTTRR